MICPICSYSSLSFNLSRDSPQTSTTNLATNRYSDNIFAFFKHLSVLFSRTKTCSASLSRSHTGSVSIKGQPPNPATKLRRIPITRHGTIARTACDNSRGLDPLSLAVATAVTPTGSHVSIIVSRQGTSYNTYSEPNSRPIYWYLAQ